MARPFMQLLSLVPFFKEMVGRMLFQQPELPRGDHDVALDGSTPAIPETVETEGVGRLSHDEDKSKHQGTESQAGQEEAGPEIPELTEEGQRIDQYEHLGGMSLEAPKRGKKRALSTGNCPRKKRSRGGNWTVPETETLVESKVRALREKKTCMGRFGKSGEAVWQEIAADIPGRTSDQCRMRWDTLVRSHKKIKVHCENHKAEFSELKEEDFQRMKLAPYFRNAEWFKIMDESCPSRPLPALSGLAYVNGASTSTGASGELTAAQNVASLDALPAVLETASSPVDQSETASARVEALAHVSRTQSEPLNRADPVLDQMPRADDREDCDADWIQYLLTGDPPIDYSFPEGSDWIGAPLLP